MRPNPTRPPLGPPPKDFGQLENELRTRERRRLSKMRRSALREECVGADLNPLGSASPRAALPSLLALLSFMRGIPTRTGRWPCERTARIRPGSAERLRSRVLQAYSQGRVAASHELTREINAGSPSAPPSLAARRTARRTARRSERRAVDAGSPIAPLCLSRRTATLINERSTSALRPAAPRLCLTSACCCGGASVPGGGRRCGRSPRRLTRSPRRRVPPRPRPARTRARRWR
jgi:hypothetical protein